MKLSHPLLFSSLLVLPLAACDCGDVDQFFPSGFLNPTVLDLGPVPIGETCSTQILLVNDGSTELRTEGARFADTNGDFAVTLTPALVSLSSSEPVLFNYTAGGNVGDRQSGNIEVQTNISDDNGGVLTGTVSALVTDSPSAIAVSECEGETPCPLLDFEAVQVDDAIVAIEDRIGRTVSINIVNTGDAPMEVSAVLIEGGNGNFAPVSVTQGDIIVETPATVAAGRPAPCQPPLEDACLNRETCNILSVDVKFAPSTLGAQNAELVVITDALEGSQLRIPLSGLGSDVGLLTNPPTVVFGEVAEGGTSDFSFIVSNIGTNEASVNNSCLDLGGDGTCEGDCTGGDPTLEGALSCEVFTSDDVHEGKGFVLAATDASPGGDDERNIVVTWSPVAGNAAIPLGTVLRLESNILGNRVYEVPVLGGSVGELEASADAADLCDNLICVRSEGDSTDTQTWTGDVTFTLQNTGDASLEITAIALDGPETVADDFVLEDTQGNAINLAAPGITLSPNASESFVVQYSNNDASRQDIIDFVFSHTGASRELVVSVAVVEPAAE